LVNNNNNKQSFIEHHDLSNIIFTTRYLSRFTATPQPEQWSIQEPATNSHDSNSSHPMSSSYLDVFRCGQDVTHRTCHICWLQNGRRFHRGLHFLGVVPTESGHLAGHHSRTHALKPLPIRLSPERSRYLR
jgi:hypothetical protein